MTDEIVPNFGKARMKVPKKNRGIIGSSYNLLLFVMRAASIILFATLVRKIVVNDNV